MLFDSRLEVAYAWNLHYNVSSCRNIGVFPRPLFWRKNSSVPTGRDIPEVVRVATPSHP